MKEDLQKLYSDFYNNNLSKSDSAIFVERLNSDIEFKENYDIFVSMQTFLNKKIDHGDALEKLRDFHEQSKYNDYSSNNLTKNITIGLLTAIALFLTYYFTNKKSTSTDHQKLYAQIYEGPNWPISRGGDTTLEEAIYNFRNNNKLVALDSFYNSKQISQFEKNYWLAELYLTANQPDSTLVLINKINNTQLRDRLIYLELMSYLQKNDILTLKEKLEVLPSDISSFYQKKISIIIETID